MDATAGTRRRSKVGDDVLREIVLHLPIPLQSRRPSVTPESRPTTNNFFPAALFPRYLSWLITSSFATPNQFSISFIKIRGEANPHSKFRPLISSIPPTDWSATAEITDSNYTTSSITVGLVGTTNCGGQHRIDASRQDEWEFRRIVSCMLEEIGK